MKNIIAVLAVSLFSVAAFAAGGKVQHQALNPVVDEDCVYNLPVGVDLEDCKELPASPDGTAVYACPPYEGDIVVVCVEDE